MARTYGDPVQKSNEMKWNKINCKFGAYVCETYAALKYWILIKGKQQRMQWERKKPLLPHVECTVNILIVSTLFLVILYMIYFTLSICVQSQLQYIVCCCFFIVTGERRTIEQKKCKVNANEIVCALHYVWHTMHVHWMVELFIFISLCLQCAMCIGDIRHFDTQRCCQFIEHNKWMQCKHKHITNVYKERTNFTAIELKSFRNTISCAVRCCAVLCCVCMWASVVFNSLRANEQCMQLYCLKPQYHFIKSNGAMRTNKQTDKQTNIMPCVRRTTFSL